MKIIEHSEDIPADLDFGSSVAIDTEAMGLQIHRDRLCLVQLCSGNGEAHLVKFSSETDYEAPNLRKLLQDENILKIFHYARFDVAILKYYLGVWAYPCYCTKLASKLARTYSSSHSLKELCQELLGIKLNKAQQTSNWGSKTLTQDQKHYAASDVLYLHAIKEKLDIMLVDENRDSIFLDCCKFLPVKIALDLQGWDDVDIFSHS